MVIQEKPLDLFPQPRDGQEEELFGDDGKSVEKPLPIEYQAIEDPRIEEEDQVNDNKFFITEDEVVRKGNKKENKFRIVNEDPIIQEENYDPNLQGNSESIDVIEEQASVPLEDDDYGRLKMNHFKEMCRNILGEK